MDELAFQMIEEDYSAESFGNAFVTLESSVLQVRFVLDRDQTFIYLAPPTSREKWPEIYFVLEAIHGKEPEAIVEFDEVAIRLRNHFPELVEALGPRLGETEREMERLAGLRLAEMRKGFFRSPSR